jgi:ABC-2 type transport system ATP-binding protein
MIEAQSLTRRYGEFTAVDAISFDVREGEIVGLLGPNGAGKTTVIRMITGFLPPSSGQIQVAGHDLFREAVGARREIGYLPENVALYPEMRVDEYLNYRARLEGVAGDKRRTAIDRASERCMLGDVRRQIIGTLSKGFRQRVGLAAAILHRPPVLVLDEPTVGLDPRQIIAIRELIRELAQESTLLLSTHILPEVELLCDRVVILDRGRIVAEGTPESLGRRWSGAALLHVTVQDAPPQAPEVLSAIAGVAGIEAAAGVPGRWTVRCAGEADPAAAVFQAAVEHGWVLTELAPERASLEDVFVRLTTREEATSFESMQGDEEVPS